MRKIWGKSSKRLSISPSLKSRQDDDSAQSQDAADREPSLPTSHVRALIRPDYDTKLVKHAWVNAVLSASISHDFTEASLRLYRVELRGSHLYIFRPPPQLGVRLFRIDLLVTAPELSLMKEPDGMSVKTDYSQLASPGPPSIPDSSTVHHSSTDEIPLSVSSSLATPIDNRTAPTKLDVTAFAQEQDSLASLPLEILFYSPLIPHPDLKFDESANTFQAGSSVEALVHFFLFADDATYSQPLRHLTSVLPILPKFGNVLKMLLVMLRAIHDGKFQGTLLSASIVGRVINLFNHIDQNFSGFLLKSDVAPHILKVLEFLTEVSIDDTADRVSLFKTSMLSKQHVLLNLVDRVDSAAASASPAENPLLELNTNEFMDHTNLLDLVTSITEIDLQFFQSWNSSIDKSLLLYTSICESTPGDYFYKKNPLIFNNDNHIHYLSRLLIHHLFIESPHASAEKRARILEKWIDLGCLLDKFGNMSSWLGISSIILSQPILRLTTVWTHVSDDYIKLLKNDWSPVLFELDRRHLANSYESLTFGNSSSTPLDAEVFSASKESYHIMAPRGLGKIYPKEQVIPYFGDLLVNNTQSTNIADLETVWKKINFSFERWNDYLKNLFNSTEIIAYNQDVIRRYESMGFIFSNESLNQVLYLGVNKDDDKSIPQSIKNIESPTSSEADRTLNKKSLQVKLLRLLDLNCESLNLDIVMKYSLNLEPCLPEKYIKKPLSEVDSTLQNMTLRNDSSISVSSSSSLTILESTGTVNSISGGSTKPRLNAEDKLPVFNNRFYKIKLEKYDNLVPGAEDVEADRIENHNIVIFDDLVLRIDDFVSDFDANVTPVTSSGGEAQQEGEDEGLGIDVDDILNSEKFRTFSTSDASHNGDDHSSRKHRSFGLVSSSSNANIHSLAPKFVPRFATVDKLIDVLLIDFKYFDSAYPIDLTEYRFVFMLNYSSFMTTTELLESLAHRFINSGNAVISVMKLEHFKRHGKYDPTTFGKFPNWEADSSVNVSLLGEVDFELLLTIQVNILKALIVLVNYFFNSFSNDLRNKKIMIKLLKLYSNEILQWYNSNKIDHTLNKSFESLVNFYKRLKKLFVKKSYRPIEALKFDIFLTHQFKFSNSMHDVPMNRNLPSPKNIHKIEKFLNKFNKLLAVFYKGITPENWFTVFKILENLFSNHSLLNYTTQKSTVPEELLTIGNIFTYFESLYDENSKDVVFKKLPLVFRKLFKLYFKFKAYLMIQLCDPNISAEERLDRMKTLLLMVKISKLKMADSQFVFEGDCDEIPSCIETAIANVIYTPESRTFATLWARASSFLEPSENDPRTSEDIDALLPNNVHQSDLMTGNEPLLPCFGWVIQNLIEINRCPSFHRQAVNFNKRYLIFKLIKELSVEESNESDELHNETKEFEFLLKLDESLGSISEVRASNVERHGPILFRDILQNQYAILNNKDRRVQLMENKLGQELSASFGHISRKTSSNQLRRQSLSYKTNSSSRFKISGLFNKSRLFGLNSIGERILNFDELPDPESCVDPKQKPALIMQLKEKKIFPVYILPHCFKIDTDSSNELCFFQVSDKDDLKDWLKKLSYANRHWFFSRSINTLAGLSTTTYGIPLKTICSRDNAKVPQFLCQIFSFIEAEGLKDVGIYRISTSISELNKLKQEIDRNTYLNLAERNVDVHALTSCVKLFFRELPDALISDHVVEMLATSKRVGEPNTFTDKDTALYKQAMAKLPEANYHTLAALARHLNKIVEQNEFNKMTSSNLATVIGPALTEASNLESLINNFGLLNHILEKIIENCETIFDSE